MAHKQYVAVKVEVNTVGEWKPLLIYWPDGRQYEITQVTDVRRAASQAAGGTGIRYTCLIKDKPRYLYYENPKWFVEAK